LIEGNLETDPPVGRNVGEVGVVLVVETEVLEEVEVLADTVGDEGAELEEG
jgi:hypothetical protein